MLLGHLTHPPRGADDAVVGVGVLMSISTPPPQGRCTEINTFAYPKINDLEVLFLVSQYCLAT